MLKSFEGELPAWTELRCARIVFGGAILALGLAHPLSAQNVAPKDYWYCIGGDRDQVVYSAVFRRPFSYMNGSTISSDWLQSRAFKYLSRDASLSSQCVGAGQDPGMAKVRRDEAVAEMQKALGAGSAIDTEWSP
jgi:hypothetical protein